MKILLVIALSFSAAFAQTVKVVPLSPADAAKAKELHKAVESAKLAYDVFYSDIAAQYISSTRSVSGVTYYSLDYGWEDGFEYSDNFLFIVPKPSPDYIRYGSGFTGTKTGPEVPTQNTGGQMYPEESTPFTRCLRDPNCIASVSAY